MTQSLRERPLSLTIVTLALALLMGCSTPGESPLDRGSGATDTGHCDCLLGLDGGSSSTSATVSGTFWDWINNAPNVGTTICLSLGVKTTKSCTRTDSSGNYTIDVPTNRPIALDFERQGYQRAQLPLHVATSRNLGRLGVYPNGDAKKYYEAAKATYPPTTKGDLLINCAGGRKVKITPKKGVGPFYYPKSFMLDTSQYDGKMVHAMVFDLEPGTYTVDCNHPDMLCRARTGWPSTSSGAVVPVTAGAVTAVVFVCP